MTRGIRNSRWWGLVRGDRAPSLYADYVPIVQRHIAPWWLPILRISGVSYAFVQTTLTPMPWFYRRVAYDATNDVYVYAWWPVALAARILRWKRWNTRHGWV